MEGVDELTYYINQVFKSDYVALYIWISYRIVKKFTSIEMINYQLLK